MTRSRLLERLRAGADRRITLIACPAGFGKTTLLAAWRETELVHQPVAWLTLDERDNDPAVLWSYVIAALQRACPALRNPRVSGLAPATQGLDMVLPLLINEMCQLDAVTLILDDCHCLSSQAASDTLGWFIRHVPQAVRLVLSTRSEPPLPLGALRAHGEVHELDADDLRFTSGEADVYLNRRLGLGLRLAEVAGLHRRTDGWPAGLALAAYSLQRAPDRHALISTLGPSNRHMADYLLTEVLQAHDAPTQALLLRCSILDRLYGPLCDAVLKRRSSGALLETLSRTNLFVAPIAGEPGWYRVRPVFAQFLRAELERRAHGLAPALHRRAYAWFRDYGTAAEAIEHAIAAGAHAQAADLIASCWVPFARDGRHEVVLAWIARLPEAMLGSNPRLLLVEAWMLALSARWHETAEAIAAIQRLGELNDGPLADGFSSAQSSLTLLRAICPQDDVAAQLTSARRAAELEAVGSPWRPVACWALGMTLFQRGDIGEADGWFAQALALATAGAGLPVTASSLAYRSLIAGEHEDLDRQRILAAQATNLLRARGAESACGVVLLALGVSLAADGRPAEAQPQLEQSIAALPGSTGPPATMAMALSCHAAVLSALGDCERSVAMAARARAMLQSCPGARLTARRLTALEPPARSRQEGGNTELTGRELRVLKLLRSDLSERGIGTELYVSYNTVHSHVRSIYRKLGSSSRSHALKRARELELL